MNFSNVYLILIYFFAMTKEPTPNKPLHNTTVIAAPIKEK